MTTRPLWLASLETLVGAHRCEAHTDRLQEYAVDGRIPRAAVRPERMEDVASVLQWAQREKLAVVPFGSGTKMGLGEIPQRLDLVLLTHDLSQISEYDVANFTITAGAGTTFAQLTQCTAAHRQMLPLQYPCSPATLGGLIAANAYAPKRLHYGGVRDALLGLRLALPSGEIAHFGGNVVKNVAGYDMCKLFLGSLGALGVIVEATWKLSALPEREASLLALFPSLQQGAAAVAQLMATQLLPSQILLLNLSAAQAIAPDAASWVASRAVLLLVNCEGMHEAVERQLADIARLCRGHSASGIDVLADEAQRQLQTRVGALTSPSPLQLDPFMNQDIVGRALIIRLGTLPSQVHVIMDAAARALQPLVSKMLLIGDCGVGMVKLCLRAESLATGAIDARLVDALRQLSGLVATHGGYAVVENAPQATKAQLEVWGAPPSSFPLVKALKRKFDPEGVLSPGRFIGGL